MEKSINFKNELAKLDEIVNKIESGDLSLDESLKLYEEGEKIISQLQEALKAAEEKVEKIIDTKGK